MADQAEQRIQAVVAVERVDTLLLAQRFLHKHTQLLLVLAGQPLPLGLIQKEITDQIHLHFLKLPLVEVRGAIVAVKQIAADLAAVANKILEHTELALLVKAIEVVVALVLLVMVQAEEVAQIKLDLMEQAALAVQAEMVKPIHGQALLDTLLAEAVVASTQLHKAVVLAVLVVAVAEQQQLVLMALQTLVAVAVAADLPTWDLLIIPAARVAPA
ncbi:hypothetical protein K0U83_24670, partial [bacterium]|nr:hypothetical protein [bacterium]